MRKRTELQTVVEQRLARRRGQDFNSMFSMSHFRLEVRVKTTVLYSNFNKFLHICTEKT